MTSCRNAHAFACLNTSKCIKCIDSNIGCAIGGHVSLDSSAGVLERNSAAVSRCAHASWLSITVIHISFLTVLNFNFEFSAGPALAFSCPKMQHRGSSVRSAHLKRVVCSWMHTGHIMVHALLWLPFCFFTGRSKFGRLFSFCLVSTCFHVLNMSMIFHKTCDIVYTEESTTRTMIFKTITNLALHPTELLLFLLLLLMLLLLLLLLSSMSSSFATLPYLWPLTEAPNREKLPPRKKCLSLAASMPSGLKEHCGIFRKRTPWHSI